MLSLIIIYSIVNLSDYRFFTPLFISINSESNGLKSSFCCLLGDLPIIKISKVFPKYTNYIEINKARVNPFMFCGLLNNLKSL